MSVVCFICLRAVLGPYQQTFLLNRSNTEVLLKRYTHSQAFINVKAALAQFFRRSVSGHPFPLPVASLTEHIQQWALEEVGYIAAMDVPAMQQVFLNFWKFKDSWCSVLEPTLPNDLKDLQVYRV